MGRLLVAALLLSAALLGGRAVAAAEPRESEDVRSGRSTAAAAPVAERQAAVAGVWALTVETSAGVGTPNVEFEQSGHALTGTYTGRFGAQPLSGSVDGNAIRFVVNITGPMGSAEVTYAGTIDGDLMQGTMQMGPGMDGTFTARRQP